MTPSRPYPTLPPPQQKKPVCVIPFPTSYKKYINPREILGLVCKTSR